MTATAGGAMLGTMGVSYVLANLHWFVLLLVSLVLFHELGHFIFAKLFDVKVTQFSIGFGPRLFSVRKGETEYRVGLLPLGGYVKMLGQFSSVPVSPEDAPRSYDAKPVWQRALIVLAGPMFNFVLAFVVLLVALSVPRETWSTQIGYTIPGSPAWQAGMRPGDTIAQVNGEDVQAFAQLRSLIGGHPGEAVHVTLEREGARRPVTIVPETQLEADAFDEPEKQGRIGITSAYALPVVAVVDPTSPAAQAGLQSGDRVLTVANQPVHSFYGLHAAMATRPGREPVPLRVQRDGATLDLTLTPSAHFPAGLRANALSDNPLPLLSSADTAQGYTGLVSADTVVTKVLEGTPAAEMGLRPGDRLLEIVAVNEAKGTRTAQPIGFWATDLRAFDGYGALENSFALTYQRGANVHRDPLRVREVAVKDELAGERRVVSFGAENNRELTLAHTTTMSLGPAGAASGALTWVWSDMTLIARALGRLAQGKISLDSMGGPIMLFVIAEKTANQGWEEFVRVLAFISVNLGLVNLIPVPALDGGHLLFCLIEAVRRQPPSLRVKELAHLAGFVFLVLLMLLIIRNDIMKYVLQ